MQLQFDHEKLRVYKQAIEFVVWCNNLLEKVPKSTQFTTNLIELQLQFPSILQKETENFRFSRGEKTAYWNSFNVDGSNWYILGSAKRRI